MTEYLENLEHSYFELKKLTERTLTPWDIAWYCTRVLQQSVSMREHLFPLVLVQCSWEQLHKGFNFCHCAPGLNFMTGFSASLPWLMSAGETQLPPPPWIALYVPLEIFTYGDGNPLCILAWEIPWTEEPGGLQSMGSQKVRHSLATKQQQYFWSVQKVVPRSTDPSNQSSLIFIQHNTRDVRSLTSKRSDYWKANVLALMADSTINQDSPGDSSHYNYSVTKKKKKNVKKQDSVSPPRYSTVAPE